MADHTARQRAEGEDWKTYVPLDYATKDLKLRGQEIAKLAKRVHKQRQRIRALQLAGKEALVVMRECRQIISDHFRQSLAQEERIGKLLVTVQELKTRNHHLEAIHKTQEELDGLGRQNQSSDTGL